MRLWHLELISADGLSVIVEWRGAGRPPEFFSRALHFNAPKAMHGSELWNEEPPATYREYRLKSCEGRPSFLNRKALTASYAEVRK